MQGLGQVLDAAPQRLADRVLHRQLEAALDLLVRLDAQIAHLLDRPPPDVVFLLAPLPEAVEPDHVVPPLVEEDREPERRLRPRGLDPVDDAAVVIVDAPRAPA